MHRTVALVVLALALAGCTGQAPQDPQNATPGNGSPGSTPTGTGPAPASDPPSWQVGDHWTYRLTGPDIDRDATIAVANVTEDAYITRTDDPETAFFDARFDVSYLGPQYKVDLAGSQGETHVTYFDWPLTEGKTWTTTWDGIEREVTVEATPDGAEGVYGLVARDPNGTVDVRYTYDPAARWFDRMQFLQDNGTTFALELTATGSAFDGEVVTYRLDEIVDANHTGVQGFSATTTLSGNHDDVWWRTEWQASQPGDVGWGWSATNATATELDGGQPVHAQCPCEHSVAQGTIEVQPGDWSFSGGTTLPLGGGYMDTVILVRDRRTQTVPSP